MATAAPEQPQMPVDRSPHPAAEATAGCRPTRTALVLSGGNALGPYHAGAYQALHASGRDIDWVVGTSVGAINAAIIVGSPAGEREERLRRFWSAATWPDVTPPVPRAWRRGYRLASALTSLTYGQPTIFRPRWAEPWQGIFGLTGTPADAGLYDLSPLARTLDALVDFDRLNGGEIRLTVTAVDLATGDDVVFDTTRDRIGVMHLLAGSAFVPEFAPVEIDGRWLCDGGFAMNTPLDIVLGEPGTGGRLCFAVDLFNGTDPLPSSPDALLERRQDLIFANQTRKSLDAHRTAWRLRRAIAILAARLPPEMRSDPEVADILSEGAEATTTVVIIRQRRRPDDTALKMYDFSSTAAEERWAAGAEDMAAALHHLVDRGGGHDRPGLEIVAPQPAVTTS